MESVSEWAIEEGFAEVKSVGCNGGFHPGKCRQDQGTTRRSHEPTSWLLENLNNKQNSTTKIQQVILNLFCFCSFSALNFAVSLLYSETSVLTDRAAGDFSGCLFDRKSGFATLKNSR